jgi:hypothetical protein
VDQIKVHKIFQEMWLLWDLSPYNSNDYDVGCSEFCCPSQGLKVFVWILYSFVLYCLLEKSLKALGDTYKLAVNCLTISWTLVKQLHLQCISKVMISMVLLAL